MLTAIGAAIGPVLRVVADWFDGENSADMVKAKKAQNIQDVKDAAVKAVATGDTAAIEKDIS